MNILVTGGAGYKFFVVNLGGASGISVWEMVEAVRDIVYKDLKYEYVGSRDGDVSMLVADATKAHNLLGWVPLQSTLGNIIKSTWSMYNG